jgi:opacity protein-like surface antigen
VPVLLAVAAAGPVAAEQVAKKVRLSLSVGAFNGDDDVESDSANVLNLREPDLSFDSLFRDPRNDSAVFSSLGIESSPIVTLAGQYAVNNIFIVEGSVGYQKGDLGNVEVQAQFEPSEFEEVPFNFRPFLVDGGELTRIPVMLTAMGRFRPRASFNPYLGGGVGYAFIGYDTSPEFDALSQALDASIGGQTRLTPSIPGTPELVVPSPDQFTDLEGATVDARDTFEWHVAGGAEYSFKRGMAAFLDARYTLSSRSIRVGFNNGTDLGIAVPQLTDFTFSPVAFETFGAVFITQGGLVDGGQLVQVPLPNFPPTTNCQAQPQFFYLEFMENMPDGVLDPGLYYVQGGEFKYDGLALQVGFRYTFK